MANKITGLLLFVGSIISLTHFISVAADDWPSYGGDNGSQKYSALDQINASNVAGISAWSNSAGGTTPAASSIVLGANGYKVKGIHNIDLNWSGTTGDVEVIRDGVVITSVNSGSSYTDNTGKKGSATYVYKVCNSGPASSSCSADVVIVF